MENNEKENKIESQDLGKLKTNSKKSPIGIIIFMIILITTVIFLPNITKYIDELKNPIKDNNKDNNEEEDNNEDIDELTYNELTSSIVLNKITFNNFKLNYTNDYYLTLDIENKSTDNIKFNISNYYLELYNENKTLLERIKVIGNELNINSKSNYTLQINNNTFTNAKLILVREISANNYPVVDLNNNTLICTNNNSKITYKFIENKLNKIEHLYTYSNSNLEEYSTILNNYKEKSNNLNNINGIITTVVENDTSFVYNTTIDLSVANMTSVNEITYYSKDTLARVVNFEMEAMRYDCK